MKERKRLKTKNRAEIYVAHRDGRHKGQDGARWLTRRPEESPSTADVHLLTPWFGHKELQQNKTAQHTNKESKNLRQSSTHTHPTPHPTPRTSTTNQNAPQKRQDMKFLATEIEEVTQSPPEEETKQQGCKWNGTSKLGDKESSSEGPTSW